MTAKMDEEESKQAEQLVVAAYQALQHAYAPYSHFPVGAALYTADGKLYTGCNIENATFGATNCAERTAIFKAVSEGHAKITQIAIVTKSNRKASPCGICRQVLAEFMEPDGKIYLEEQGQIFVYTLAELLPLAFSL